MFNRPKPFQANAMEGAAVRAGMSGSVRLVDETNGIHLTSVSYRSEFDPDKPTHRSWTLENAAGDVHLYFKGHSLDHAWLDIRAGKGRPGSAVKRTERFVQLLVEDERPLLGSPLLLDLPVTRLSDQSQAIRSASAEYFPGLASSTGYSSRVGFLFELLIKELRRARSYDDYAVRRAADTRQRRSEFAAAPDGALFSIAYDIACVRKRPGDVKHVDLIRWYRTETKPLSAQLLRKMSLVTADNIQMFSWLSAHERCDGLSACAAATQVCPLLSAGPSQYAG